MLRVGKVLGPARSSSRGGYTYLVLLVIVAVIAVTTETTALRTSYLVRSDREAELLFRGQAYMRAIRSYYRAPGMPNEFPSNLEDLVDDPRRARLHHLRALYPDPMAGTGGEWLLITAIDGGIAGIASNSTRTPIKQANFPLELQHFEGATSYQDWVFEFDPFDQTETTR